jgi:2-polyprenyl-3-methyl-5-hydroxy-6-metoxy-1,4-benzoquinol methylase
MSQLRQPIGDGHIQSTRELFDSKATNWAKKYAGPLKLRLLAFTDTIEREIKPGARILDFGCGPGILSLALHSKGYQVDGLDVSEQMIAAARRCCPGSATLHFSQGDLESLRGSGIVYDAIVASSVIEYLPDVPNALELFCKHIDRNGKLIVTVPNTEANLRIRERMLRRSLLWITVFPLPKMLKSYLNYLKLSRNHYSPSLFLAHAKDAGFCSKYFIYLKDETPYEAYDAKQKASMILYVLDKVC